jgi:UDP-N-acetylmuramoyl-L-alanyl-D-glutamate--2,6-diaminopimelate ligase
LDFHPDFEDYFKAKAMLFERADKAAIINYDDPYGKRLVDEHMVVAPVITYGFCEDAMIRVTSVTYSASGTMCHFVTPVGEFEATICIPGDIYVMNTMACMGVLIALGGDLTALKTAISQIKPVRGRLERVGNANVIVDYAHTPDALENVIKVVRKFTAGKIITVFGCGGDRDRKKRPMMGEIAERLSDIVIVTSDNPRTEDPESILDDIFAGIKTNHEAIYRESDRKKAIGLAIEMMTADDVVVIAGKGHETYQIVGREKHHFDDAEIARDFIELKEHSLLDSDVN